MKYERPGASLRWPTGLPDKEAYIQEMADLPFPVSVKRDGDLSQAEQDACIQEMVGRIVTGFDPQRIVLFGSRARGSHDPDSDVDIFVVVDGEIDEFEASVDIRGVLRRSPLAKDVCVISNSDWDRGANVTNTLVNCALEDGVKTLYERP